MACCSHIARNDTDFPTSTKFSWTTAMKIPWNFNSIFYVGYVNGSHNRDRPFKAFGQICWLLVRIVSLIVVLHACHLHHTGKIWPFTRCWYFSHTTHTGLACSSSSRKHHPRACRWHAREWVLTKLTAVWAPTTSTHGCIWLSENIVPTKCI